MKHFHNGIHRKSGHERLVPTNTRRFRQARITLATRNTTRVFQQQLRVRFRQGNPSAAANGYPNADQSWQVSEDQGRPQNPYGQTAYTPQSNGTSGPAQIEPWQIQAQYDNGPDSSNKSKDTAAIMAFFLVGSGIRNFYLGKTGGGGHTAADHHFRSLHWAFHLFDLGQR